MEVPRGHVVRARVAEDHVLGALPWHVTAEPADDHGELSLEVHSVGELDRVGDRAPVPNHRCRRLEEQHRLGGQLLAVPK